MNARTHIQRKKAADRDIAPQLVHETLRSGGQLLDGTTRAFMEPRFGHDFSQVRAQHTVFTLVAQPKLTISQPGDPYEQEADRIADQIMRMPEPAVQRTAMDGEPEQEEQQLALPREEDAQKIQRAAEPSGKELEDSQQDLTLPAEDDQELDVRRYADPIQDFEVAPQIEAGIEALRGSGQPLDREARAFMEPRFGHDFSHVRVHTGAQAAASAQSVSALAYTVGRDVVFGAGQYRPETSEGKQLIAHELTHVMQQYGNGQRLQRRIGDSHDLQSLRFAGDEVLEACFDGEEHQFLRNGSSGPAVAKVQQAMIDLGISLPIFGVDGQFGDETGAAVAQFKREHAIIPSDPVVGPKTMAMLDELFLGGGAHNLPTTGGLTEQDVADVRIDPSAQVALVDMSRSAADEFKEAAFGLVAAVRADELGGIIGESAGVVFFGSRLDDDWSRLPTIYQSAILARNPTAAEAALIVVFREQFRLDVVALGAALLTAWQIHTGVIPPSPCAVNDRPDLTLAAFAPTDENLGVSPIACQGSGNGQQGSSSLLAQAVDPVPSKLRKVEPPFERDGEQVVSTHAERSQFRWDANIIMTGSGAFDVGFLQSVTQNNITLEYANKDGSKNGICKFVIDKLPVRDGLPEDTWFREAKSLTVAQPTQVIAMDDRPGGFLKIKHPSDSDLQLRKISEDIEFATWIAARVQGQSPESLSSYRFLRNLEWLIRRTVILDQPLPGARIQPRLTRDEAAIKGASTTGRGNQTPVLDGKTANELSKRKCS